AELVIEPLAVEIALVARRPFVQPHMRRDDEFRHGAPPDVNGSRRLLSGRWHSSLPWLQLTFQIALDRTHEAEVVGNLGRTVLIERRRGQFAPQAALDFLKRAERSKGDRIRQLFRRVVAKAVPGRLDARVFGRRDRRVDEAQGFWRKLGHKKPQYNTL